MKIAFRVDASFQMGTGHVMRCRTLANALAKRGAKIRFICRDHTGNLIDLLRGDGWEVGILPAPVGDQFGYSPWLGVSQQTDAEQSIAALNGWVPDWLVVDQYGLDRRWETLLRPYAGALMAIDDLADRDHRGDMLLDQNYFEEPAERYRGRLPDECRLMLGPRYGLLRPEYGAHPDRQRKRDGNVKRVMVFVGGADTADVTGRLLRVLSAPRFEGIEVDVVIGASYAFNASLRDLIARRGATRLHCRLPHLAGVMANADLALGAGGTAIWERLCMGLPSLVFSLAPNQVPVCQALAEAVAICYAGPIEDLSDDDIVRRLDYMLGDTDLMVRQSLLGQQLVDGQGAARVAEAIMPSPLTALKLRLARPDDLLAYFVWANDPDVRKNAIQSEAISLISHRTWFGTKLASDRSQLLVLEAGGLPLGQIRFDHCGDGLWIDYSLDRLVRGRGWARHLVAMGLRAVRQDGAGCFRAEVKVDNPASISIFRSSGFEELQANADGLRSFRLLIHEHARTRT